MSFGRQRRILARTRMAFIVIIVFVVAQVVWWLLFQERYIAEVMTRTEAAWRREAVTASLAATADPGLAEELTRTHPHLSRLASGGFEVDPAQLRRFEARQIRYLRMFWFEAPFFVIVVLMGLHVIGRSVAAGRELKRRQQNFLSAVTHEFRTPISTLRLLIETATYRELPPERLKDYLRRMEAELSRLQSTSDRVLATARLEHAAEPFSLAPADLNEAVRACVEARRSSLEARGAEIQVEYAPAPLHVMLEPGAFELVLDNLLDNAIKYTPGSVKPLRIRLEATNGRALLHVEDEGVGVAASESEAIFEAFYRPGDEMTRSSTGVGLGLYLARSILEEMDAELSCHPTSPPGRGTRFTLAFPSRPSRQERPAPHDRDAQGSSATSTSLAGGVQRT